MRRILRLGLFLLVGVSIWMLPGGPSPWEPCSTGHAACDSEAPRCGRRLGPWSIARSRDAPLSPGQAHSACVPAVNPWPDKPTVRVVPPATGMPGDTLVARLAGSSARVRIASRETLPDHWAFVVGGRFLDRGSDPSCPELSVRPPVNAGYGLIGANWQGRPAGFYFERMIDACVYDGRDERCPGEAPFIPHHFEVGETFEVELRLTPGDGDQWRLSADVARIEDGARQPPLGSLARSVAPPCWLRPGDPGQILVVVIAGPGAEGVRPWVDVGAPEPARSQVPTSSG